MRRPVAAPELNQALRGLSHTEGIVTAKEVEEVRQRMRQALGDEARGDFDPLANASFFLVVSTKDTAAANNQVTAYFKENGITGMNAGTTVLADALGRDDLYRAGGARGRNLTLKSEAGVDATD